MYRQYKEVMESNEPLPSDETISCAGATKEMKDISAEDMQNKKDDSEIQVEAEVRAIWEKEQLELKQKLILEDVPLWAKNRVVAPEEEEWPPVWPGPLRYLGGVDISFVKGDNINACAALVVIQLPSMEVVYEDCSHVELTAPYIPGFLAFREVKFLVDKIEKLKATNLSLMPQVILCDGNGILHPREFGVACHLGVLLDVPTLGAAKKLFQVFGLENDEEHKRKIEGLVNAQDNFPLVGDSGRTLGVALRSNGKTKNPIYISPGHQLSVDSALWVVQQCCPYRVPEPIRQADIRSREFLRQHFPSEEDSPKVKPKKKKPREEAAARRDSSRQRQGASSKRERSSSPEQDVDTSFMFGDDT